MKYSEQKYLLVIMFSIIIGLDFSGEMKIDPLGLFSEPYENLFQNLSLDGNEATCAINEWRKFTMFKYGLENIFEIKKLTLIMIDQDDFEMLVSVAKNSSEESQSCKISVGERLFFSRRTVTAVCQPGTFGNVIIIQDQRSSKEFFGICKLTISGEPKNIELKTDIPIEGTPEEGFFLKLSINHLYIGLGCLAAVITVIVIIVCLLKRERRRRNSETAPYYSWTNGANAGSEETIVTGNEAPNSRRIIVPAHCRVPLPLPRDVNGGHSMALRHLQGRSDANPNHYSVVAGPSDYMTILETPNYKGTFDPHLYEEFDPDRKVESLYADCTTVPQPPSTRFSQLETFVRFPGSRRAPHS